MKATHPRKKELAFRVIRVHGTLAKLLKRRTFRAAVRSPQEAIRFLLANYPELEGYMRPRYFQVTVGNCVVNEETIGLPTGVFEEICITPAICGAGGPVGQVITGIALVTLSIFVPFVAPVLLPLGIGLTLTGVAGLITPATADRPESTDSRDSYNFNGLQQTSREGPPVPLVYGDIVTGSIVLSVNIEEDEEELGAGAGAGGGAGGGAAADANALFEAGAGDPNPDPNPVPDLTGPVLLTPIYSTIHSFVIEFGLRQSSRVTKHCFGDEAGQIAATTPVYDSETRKGPFIGKALRVTINSDVEDTDIVCQADPNTPGVAFNERLAMVANLEILDHQGYGGVVTPGWSLFEVYQFTIHTSVQDVYTDPTAFFNAYILNFFIDGAAQTIPGQFAAPADFNPSPY